MQGQAHAQDTNAHLKVEFGLDTLQVAKNRYASEQCHDFIGFQVAQPLLERVFPVIYGLQLKDVLTREDLAIGSYRFSVSRLIPQMTKVALQTHRKDLMRETPNFAKRNFLYRLKRSDYDREWGTTYAKPGFATRVMAMLLRYVPKFGPLKGMGFDNPTPKTEDLHIKSINTTVDQYRIYLAEAGAGKLALSNRDLDDGKITEAAEYTLADDTYTNLLAHLAATHFEGTSPQLRDNILAFYSNLALPIATRRDSARWESVMTNLSELKAVTPAPVASLTTS